jgi:ATP-binding protein involved in chromosome partitioning
MLGTEEQPQALSEREILPVQAAMGLKMISMGLLNPGDKPMIWRGPMLHSVMQQFLRSVQWGELDYLIIDLPPGTGDVQLSPDPACAGDGRCPGDHAFDRGAGRCAQSHGNVSPGERGYSRRRREHEFLQLPALPRAHRRLRPRRRPAHRGKYGVPLLGEIEIDPQIRIGGDTGKPVALLGPDAPGAKSIYAMARAVAARWRIFRAAAIESSCTAFHVESLVSA